MKLKIPTSRQTTPRILITGSSHVGAIRKGVQLLQDSGELPDVDISYLAGPAKAFASFSISPKGSFGLHRGTQSPRSEAVEKSSTVGTSVSLQKFDLLIVCGLNWGQQSLAETLGFFGVDGLSEPAEGQHRMSADAYDAYFHELVREKIDTRWTRHDAGPEIIIIPEPHRSERVLDQAYVFEKGLPWKNSYKTPDIIQAQLERLESAVKAGLEAQGAHYLRQPKETLTSQDLTKAIYSIAKPEIVDGAFSDNDFGHMNDEYGRLCLKQLFEHVERLEPATLNKAVAS